MNDERPIEKLLRRCAKKRRDDAGTPVELHPAARRLLQGEVARQFPRRSSASDGEPTTFAQVLKLWRRQLIWALPVLIVLGIGVWMLVGPSEKPGAEFDLARNASAPAAPAEVVESAFKSQETPAPAVAAASTTSLGDQPTLSYAKGGPVRDGLESSGATAESHGDKFGVALKGETIRLKRDDAQTARELAAISQNEPALKLETDRVAANDFAQPATGDQLRGQSVVAKRALVEEPNAFYDENTQTKGLALAAPAKSDSLEGFESTRKDYVAAGAGTRASAPASPPAVFAPETASAKFYRQEARGADGRDNRQAYSQTFVNRAPAPSSGKMAKSAAVSPVLANFQVEQTGNQLRVIDGDGSTYIGEMELPAAGQPVAIAVENKGAERSSLKSGDKLVARRFEDALSVEQQSMQNFACNVSGTNRTLNQQVIFSWNFVTLTNGLAAAQVKSRAGGANVLKNNLPAQQFPLLLNNSFINGRAQLSGAKDIEINAVPVKP